MNVLIIAAHPDDEILGMGGTILKHTTNNDRVTIVYLATGIAARKSDHQLKSKEDKKLQNEILELRKHSKKAAKILQVTDVKFYDFPDNQMDSVTLLNVVKAIEKEIVVAAVVDQIQIDIDKDETEALRMLVEYLPESILLSYLPDDYLEKGNVS